MVVLGLTMNHDSSVCIVKDGVILSAITRERISRVKKDRYVTQKMLDYVLEDSGITMDDVDYVALSYWYENRTDWKNEYEDIKMYIRDEDSFIFTQNFKPLNGGTWERPTPEYVDGKGWYIKEDLVYLSPPYTERPVEHIPINLDIYGRTIPGWFVNHHHAHAASAYYTTNLESSAIFTLDVTDTNPYSCSLFSYGYGNKLETLYYPGINIGHAYNIFTELIGLGSGLYKAGTLMGLAPYGNVNPEVIKNLPKYLKTYWDREDGVDDNRWSYRLFMKTTGKPVFKRNPQTLTMYDTSDEYYCDFFDGSNYDSKEAMDAAATIQYLFEQTVYKFAEELYQETKEINGGNLCLAGGSFLNCTTNGRISKNTSFKRVEPYPGAADDGLSVGSALYVTHNLLGVDRTYKTIPEVVYTGKEYDIPENILEGSENLDLDILGKKLNEGKVIAWFQGGSEFGPRALGHRSFIANPCIPEMRDYINFEIKNREWFRPFAPAVCVENTGEYFDIDSESPYMLKICDVISDKIPSVTHIDGSARVQTVNRNDNELYYDLIRSFEKYSGVPVILNTSLNLAGEPIVETPEDCFKLFQNCDVDIMVINNKMWFKE